MTDTHELAWAAGFFDGEGHTASKRGKRKCDPQRNVYTVIIMDIRQVDRRVLDRFQKAIGGVGYIYGPWIQKNPNAQPFYVYSLTKAVDIQNAINLMWPWLGTIKRDQAMNAIGDWMNQPMLNVGRPRGEVHHPFCHPDRAYKAKGMCAACYKRKRKENKQLLAA